MMTQSNLKNVLFILLFVSLSSIFGFHEMLITILAIMLLMLIDIASYLKFIAVDDFKKKYKEVIGNVKNHS
ncbi:hypothetical protein JOD21_002714 [Jeotgalibacillus terrae]|nr:hypothetical protein [Jeotgalibacillus terrae]